MKKKKKTRKATTNRIMPYIQSAVLCEKVLREERVSTLVRIIDTITIAGLDKSITPGVISYFVHVAFKAGDARGKRTLKLTGWSPSIFRFQSKLLSPRDLKVLGGFSAFESHF